MKKFVLLVITALIIISLPPEILAAEGEIFSFRFQESGNDAAHLFTPIKLNYDDMMGEGVITYAKRIANELSNMPEGKHCIDLTLISAKLDDEKENHLWWDIGVDNLRAVTTQLYKELKANGAVIDYVIDDFEGGMSMWSIKREDIEEIMRDSRYETEIRPLLVENGFEFSSDGASELDLIFQYTQNNMYHVWNGVMSRRVSEYYNRTMYEPIKEFYPDVKYSNYGMTESLGLNKIYDGGGHKDYLMGRSYKAGTHSSPVLYGGLGAITKPGRQPEDYPHDKFDATSYNTVLFSLIQVQDVITSGDGKIMPWIPCINAADSDINNDYYNELVFHLGLLGAEPVLLFNPASENLINDENHLSALLGELNEILGSGFKNALINNMTQWDSSYLLSGMETADKAIWRITPDLYVPGVSIDSFLLDKEKLVFQIGNQVVIFPEGSQIIENTMSDYGYWIESPKGTVPKEIRAEGIEAPLAPVLTEDNIPSGYNIQAKYTKYVPESPQNQVSEPDDDKKQQISTEDIDSTHWASKALAKAVQEGIIIGSDRGIEPDRNVTYAEFITMLQRMMGVDIAGVTADVWYSPAYTKASEYGWINADYSMESDLSREYAALIVARALRLNTSVGEENAFADMASVTSNEGLKAINACAAVGIITGYPDGRFGPLNTITRAEAVVILQRALN